MENAKLFLSQKSQFDLVEKIKNKNKKRTRASLFLSSEDGKQEIYFMWPKLSQNGDFLVTRNYNLMLIISKKLII